MKRRVSSLLFLVRLGERQTVRVSGSREQAGVDSQTYFSKQIRFLNFFFNQFAVRFWPRDPRTEGPLATLVVFWLILAADRSLAVSPVQTKVLNYLNRDIFFTIRCCVDFNFLSSSVF